VISSAEEIDPLLSQTVVLSQQPHVALDRYLPTNGIIVDEADDLEIQLVHQSVEERSEHMASKDQRRIP